MIAKRLTPGRLVMVNITGTTLDREQADHLQHLGVRAVCLFRRNISSEEQVLRLTRDLREAMGEGSLIAIDQEGGAVVRATFLPQPPSAMSLGAAGDAGLAREVGEAVARGIRSLGFNWNFAPVLDVNNNPANPVISERSFGEDPAEVARLAGAWLAGASGAGVACCVKHFPGHGDTSVDSHRDLPVVDKPLEALRALELAPFRALLSRAPALMTAHILYPRIDPDLPATLSPRILGDLLRREWGYEGVVITDALDMHAIHKRFGHERAAVLALRAGADMVMALGPPEEQALAVQAIARSLESGELGTAALARSLERLDALGARFPVDWPPYAMAQRAADEDLMQRAWAAGLAAYGAPQAPARGRGIRVVTQADVPGDGVSEAGLSEAGVRRIFAGVPDVEFTTCADLDALDWRDLPGDGRLRILASNRRARYAAASAGWHPDLHLALWNPYHALDVDAPAVISWGHGQGAIHALREWLLGRAALPGRMPVRLAA